ncbi:hypothetical protein NL676_034927 [Syzygium grande]|nr:hypothetical protein NL676_034927 [Syzygium grande]
MVTGALNENYTHPSAPLAPPSLMEKPWQMVSKRKGPGKPRSMVSAPDADHSGSALNVDPPTSLPDIGKDGLSSSTFPSVSSDSNKSSDDSTSEIDSKSEEELAPPASSNSRRVERKDTSKTLEPVYRLPSPDRVGPPSDPVNDLAGVSDLVNQRYIPRALERVSGLPIPSTVGPSFVLV